MPTVLVVDDEEMVREMIARMLKQDGFSVLTAGSGVDAMEVSRSHRGEIDLLVSDVTMPEMDGCTLADELHAENPDLPVLLLSGYYQSALVERCGRFSMLPKPFSMKSFLSMVRRLLGKQVQSNCGA